MNAQDFFSPREKKILVVDDSNLARTACGDLLMGAGYLVSFAGNGAEAIQIAMAQPFDLILLDIIMPSMDGIETCRRLKREEKLEPVPVIMTTAAEESTNLEKAFEAGAMDYITKPIRQFEILARLKSALLLKAREQELIRKNEELENAFKEIKVLQGFIPICAWCKKIRDLEGDWKKMETYIEKHSLAKFSHGICKECAANKALSNTAFKKQP